MPSGYENFLRRVRQTFRKPRKAARSLKDRMLDKMRAEGIDVPGTNAEYELKRTRAGWSQRSAGAWSWFIIRKWRDDVVPVGEIIGSCAPLKECVKKGAPIYPNRLSGRGWETDAPDETKPVHERHQGKA